VVFSLFTYHIQVTMGKTYDHIPDNLIEWARKQEMFWVATAPLSADGHVNLSPKGLRGTFHIEGPNKVWYEDLTGSGAYNQLLTTLKTLRLSFLRDIHMY
jgi:hypothetical protein